MAKKFQANQHRLDPRSADFLAKYLNPESETYSNALQSALSAGYSQEYSENILALMPAWLSESIGDNELIKKAMSNLKEFIGDKNRDQRLKYDATAFTLKSLYKRKFGADKEPQGTNVTFQVTNYYAQPQADRQGTQ